MWLLAASVIFGFAAGFPSYLFDDAAAQSKDTQTIGEAGVRFTTIDSAQLAAMLQRKDFFFVNVHIPYEGEIKGTDAHIAFDKIAENLDRLPPDRSAKLVLYCRSGRMSEIAAGELTRLGYSNVAHLSGGMIEWKARGNDLTE